MTRMTKIFFPASIYQRVFDISAEDTDRLYCQPFFHLYTRNQHLQFFPEKLLQEHSSWTQVHQFPCDTKPHRPDPLCPGLPNNREYLLSSTLLEHMKVQTITCHSFIILLLIAISRRLCCNTVYISRVFIFLNS